MPTPAKPFSVLTAEKKSHRTKAELNLRKKGEKALETKQKIKAKKEVKENKIAYKEFKRISSLLESIDKSDGLYENVINRYVMLYAECYEFEIKREKFYENLNNVEMAYEKNMNEMSISEYFSTINGIQKNIIDLDKQIQSKRKMMLEIEKENIMTIAAQLRSIPKKVDEEEDKVLKVLRGEA